MSRVIAIVGNDKWGSRLASELIACHADIPIYIDRSSNPKRLVKLLQKGRMRFSWIARMAWAELLRKRFPLPVLPTIGSNQELRDVIEKTAVKTIYVFRGGLIVNKSVLGLGAEFLNIHAASLPLYGGLGSIPRALADGAFAQDATLHRMTAEIDKGEVLDTEPYLLDARLSYRVNEDAAYTAAVRLALRHLAPKK